MSPNPAVRIFAKLEMTNPTGSVKDRAAKSSSRTSRLAAGSGRTRSSSSRRRATPGIALAMIGRRKGYRVALVMPDNVTPERRQMARPVRRRDHRLARGARVERRDRASPSELAAGDPRYVMPYQYGNAANPRAH